MRNSGDVSVSVSYRYTPTNDAVSGGFTDGDTAVTAPIALPANAEKSVRLILDGTPTRSLDKAVLGTEIGGD